MIPDRTGESVIDSEQPGTPTQLFIVRRGRESTFRLLERRFGSDPGVRVIGARRYRERRRRAQAPAADRRRIDRRAPVPTVWPSTNYIVVNVG